MTDGLANNSEPATIRAGAVRRTVVIARRFYEMERAATRGYPKYRQDPQP